MGNTIYIVIYGKYHWSMIITRSKYDFKIQVKYGSIMRNMAEEMKINHIWNHQLRHKKGAVWNASQYLVWVSKLTLCGMAEYRNVIVPAFCGITGTSMDWLNVNGVYPCLPPNGWGVLEFMSHGHVNSNLPVVPRASEKANPPFILNTPNSMVHMCKSTTTNYGL